MADTVFNFGKHRGTTFQYVLDNHKGYAAWCLEQKNLRSQLRDFATFVRKSGIDVSSSQSMPCSQAIACSQQASCPQLLTCTQPAVPEKAPESLVPETQPCNAVSQGVMGRQAFNTVNTRGGAEASGAGVQTANGGAVANTTSSVVAAPATNHPFLTALQCDSELATFPSGDLARPVFEVQPTVASAPPLVERGFQSQPQMALQTPEKGQAGAPGWSTDDGSLDAFLKETVDIENLSKLETMPVTRRVAVARLLQSRIAQVRNATAYICKVISTAQQDAPDPKSVTSQDPMSSQQTAPFSHGATQPCMSQLPLVPQEPTTPRRMPSGLVMSPEPFALQQNPQSWAQLPTQPAASQGPPMPSQQSPWASQQQPMASQSLGTQFACTPSQPVAHQGPPGTQPAGAQWACIPSQPVVSQGVVVAQQPGTTWVQTLQAPMMAVQQPGGQWACVAGQPPTSSMQQPLTPWAHPACPQVITPEPVQLSPWGRVLAYLESKGIPFATVSNCHIDTRRDILKEVFRTEPVLRAQAEMDWMKNKCNAHGQSASRPPRTRSRSRDRFMQMASGARPGGGVSYIMPRY